METFIIVLLVFYVKHIVKLLPSLPSLLYPSFIPHRTIEYTIHIACVVFFIELLPEYKHRVESMNELFFSYNK